MEKDAVRKVLFQVENARKKNLQSYFTQIGLTVGQGQPRILNCLLNKDHITQKELAQECDMDVTNMSRTLDRLEEAGFLCRKRHPECRRSFLIALTEAGKEKAEEVRAGFQMIDDKIWSGFEAEEMESLVEGLKRIGKNLE